MIKLLIADQHPIVIKGIECVIKPIPNIEIKAVVGTSESLFQALKKSEIDVVIIDPTIIGFNGISVIREILEQNSKIKIIVFCGLSTSIFAPTALNQGAFAYLNKNANLDLLKHTLLTTTRSDNGNDIPSKSSSKKLKNKLSLQETKVLHLISHGLKNIEIAEKMEISEKTVSTYKSRIMNKLNITTLVDLLRVTKS